MMNTMRASRHTPSAAQMPIIAAVPVSIVAVHNITKNVDVNNNGKKN